MQTTITSDKFIESAFNYVNRHSRTLLSEKTGVDRKTIAKMLDGSLKIEEYRYPVKATQLIKEVMGFDNIDEAVEVAPESIKSKLDYANIVNINRFGKDFESHSTNSHIERMLDNDSNKLVSFILAANHSGTSFEEINFVLGSAGINESQYLIDKGILKQVNGVIKTTLENNQLCFSRAFIRNNAKIIWQYYSIFRSGKNSNYVYQATEKLNPEAVKKLYNLSRSFHQKASEIITDENSKGDIPYFIIYALDSFNSL